MTIRLSAPDRRADLPKVDRRLLRTRANRILSQLVHSPALSRGKSERRPSVRDLELSIALVADDEIAALNGQYRGSDQPTDVLSFSLMEGPHADRRGALLGDVVIGLETAARQARRRRRSLDDEVARLLIHGTLHLVGHDHARPDEARSMRAEERRLWSAIRE